LRTNQPVVVVVAFEQRMIGRHPSCAVMQNRRRQPTGTISRRLGPMQVRLHAVASGTLRIYR
jgi:hypothetical protein